MGDVHATEEISVLRRRIDEQQAVIDHLVRTVEELGSGLRGPGGAGAPVAAGDLPTPPEAPATSEGLAATTDRRRLLGSAARVAAGAVAGGTAAVLGSASPAAAAGLFDGNPAVSATNTGGSSGTAVLGVGGSGIGVDCTSTTDTVGTGALRATYGGSSTGIAAAHLEGGSGSALRGFNKSPSFTLILGNSATDGNPSAYAGGAVYAWSSADTVFASSSSSRTTAAGVHIEAHEDSNGIVGSAYDRGSGGLLSGGRCDLQLGHAPALARAPAARKHTKGHAVGELALDAATGNLWACVVAAPAGQVGTWRKLTGPTTAGALHVLSTPVRVYDSRAGNPPVAVGPKTPLVAASARTCDLKANSSGVPAGATAVLVSLVATGTTGVLGGFLSIYRNGITWPGTSSLNWSAPGQNVSVTTVTAVDANAVCNLFANVATDVVVDVLGYYQ
jgi:hypothetical protein